MGWSRVSDRGVASVTDSYAMPAHLKDEPPAIVDASSSSLVPLPPPPAPPDHAIALGGALGEEVLPLVSRGWNINEQETTIINNLFNARAFGDSIGVPVHMLRPLGNTALTFLIDANILECNDKELVKVNMQQVSLEVKQLASEPQPIITQPLNRFRFGDASKIQLLQHVLAKGFKPKPSATGFLIKGKPLNFDPVAGFGRINYLRALVLNTVIWNKSGNLTRIYHNAPNTYYVALLRIADLSGIAGLSDATVKSYSDKDWKKVLKGLQQPSQLFQSSQTSCGVYGVSLVFMYLLFILFLHGQGSPSRCRYTLLITTL